MLRAADVVAGARREGVDRRLRDVVVDILDHRSERGGVLQHGRRPCGIPTQLGLWMAE